MRRLWIVAGVVVVLAALALLIHLAWGREGFDLGTAGLGSWTYLATALLVFGDAICALLPGETTLNAASTLAADGQLELWLVILAGAAGAIAGDSALYWIARGFSGRIRPQLDRAASNAKVRGALDLLGERASILLVAGRYVPGARFVVNATLGLSHYPYRSFIVWSALGGALWAAYTCVLAYLVASALSGFPLASVIISGAITTIAIGAVIVAVRRGRARQPPPSPRPPSTTSR